MARNGDPRSPRLRQVSRRFKATERIRTVDLRFTKPLLYQLSYGGMADQLRMKRTPIRLPNQGLTASVDRSGGVGGLVGGSTMGIRCRESAYP